MIYIPITGGKYPSVLNGCASKAYASLFILDLIEILPRFPYIHTDSLVHIYDTSINEVLDIPRINSSYYMACTRTWIV